MPSTACETLERGTTTMARTLAMRARSYARGYFEMGYRPASRALLAVRRRDDLLGAAFGAWWAGLVVAVVTEPDHRRRDQIAVDLGACLQICDAGDIVDEEHLRHRDVPAFALSELAGPPVGWPARCRPSDDAVVLVAGGRAAGVLTHEDLTGGAGRAEADPTLYFLLSTVDTFAPFPITPAAT